MAFEYLLRFELQRRAPHAIDTGWHAEHAPMGFIYHVESGIFSIDSGEIDNVVMRIIGVLDNARSAVEHYRKLSSPTQAEKAELAAHAIRLANLDLVCIGRRFDWDFEKADPEIVNELLDLLEIVPFVDLVGDHNILLNPTFGEASQWVGGAYADIIAGDLLLDIKTTTKTRVEGTYLDQILGYYLLARRQRLIDPSFPEIQRLGLYYARHSCLWCCNTSVWTNHPEFHAIEEWFFQYAQEQYSSQQPSPDQEAVSSSSGARAEAVPASGSSPRERFAAAVQSVEREQAVVPASGGGATTVQPAGTVVQRKRPAAQRTRLSGVWQRLYQLFTLFLRVFGFWNDSRRWDRASPRGEDRASPSEGQQAELRNSPPR
jgi:hypothetical protein